MKKLTITLVIQLFCIIALTSCQSRLLTVYKIDIQQGNALEAEKVNKVQLGMNKEQVRFLLGNPLIVDSFHPDRWDYIYLFTPGYGEKERRQLVLFFDRGEVVDIVKDNIPEIEDDPVEANVEDEEQTDI